MPKRINVKRVRNWNLQFTIGHRAHPNAMKGYKNAQSRSKGEQDEKFFVRKDAEEKKLMAGLKKVRAEKRARAAKIASRVIKSRASARITLKNKPKVLKGFVGEKKSKN